MSFVRAGAQGSAVAAARGRRLLRESVHQNREEEAVSPWHVVTFVFRRIINRVPFFHELKDSGGYKELHLRCSRSCD